MFEYDAFGLRWRSSIALPFAERSSDGRPDVTVRFGGTPAHLPAARGNAPHAWEAEPGAALLRVADVARYLVTPREIVIDRRHLPEAVWRTYFKFAFVRNPYDRCVSACAMLNARKIAYAGNETAVMKRTLSSLKGAVNAADFRELMLLRTQTGLLMDEAGRLGMDFLGRYETLQDSFREACGRIGIPEQQLAVVNATAHRPWEDCYDDEACRLATGFYRRDFEMLDYPPAIGPLEPG